MKRFAVRSAWSAPWLVLLGIGLTYVPTGAQPADSGEFQLVARDLGVAHPPGYPLYTLAAHLFGRLVLSIPPLRHLGWPWAVNAFSLVLAVSTLAVVFRTATRLGGSPIAGAIAAALLAFAPTFAAQAVVANIRMATGLFTAILLCLAVGLAAEGGPHPPTPSPKFGGGGGSRVGGRRELVALSFVGALAAGHHPTLAALALPLGLAILLRRPAALRDRRALPRLAALCVAAALIGLLPLLYLPIRAAQHAPLAPADLATWGGVWRHVTAAGFRGDMLAITGARDLGDRLLVLGNILRLQFTPLALATMAVGAAWLVARRRAEAVALLGTALVVDWLAITYRAPQTMEYLLPAYVALAVVAGAGTSALSHALLNRLRDLPLPQTWGRGSGGEGLPRRAATVGLAILAAAAFAAVGLPMHGRAPALAVAAVPDLAAVTRLAADPECLPANATVLTSWHFATPLWLTGLRDASATAASKDAPYVTASGAPIVYVHPDFATGDPIGETWRKLAERYATDGPVVLTNRTAELSAAHIATAQIPGTPLVRLSSAPWPRRACPIPNAWQSPYFIGLGSHEDEWVVDPITLTITAQGVELHATVQDRGPVTTKATTMFAQLRDETGAVVAQSDRALVAPTSDRYGFPTYSVALPLTPFRGTNPQREVSIVVGMYQVSPGGIVMLADYAIGEYVERMTVRAGWSLPKGGATYVDGKVVRVFALAPSTTPSSDRSALVRATLPAVALGAIPFGNAMTLLGTTVHRTPTALLVDLTWRADALAALSDYTISVQAAADDASWHAQHDGTPALGAIPTLKWLPGMVIHDRHRIPLPPEAAGHDGPFTVTVGVYDAFSLEPLPVTDGELVRQGQGQRAIVYSSP